MEIKLDIILNVMIGLFIYNAIIKSFALSIIKSILNHKHEEPRKKSFKEALHDKINESKID